MLAHKQQLLEDLQKHRCCAPYAAAHNSATVQPCSTSVLRALSAWVCRSVSESVKHEREVKIEQGWQACDIRVAPLLISFAVWMG